MGNRVIRLGADPFPPYQYFDENGSVVGTDFDLVSAMFRDKGYDVTCYIDDWAVVFGKFKAKELDAVFQVQKTPERAAEFAFSPCFRIGVTEVVTADPDLVVDKYSDIAEKGLKMGVSTGYSYGDAIDSLPAGIKTAYDTMEQLLAAVANKEVDVAVIDRGVKEFILERSSLPKLYNLPALDFDRDFYVMYHKDADFTLD